MRFWPPWGKKPEAADPAPEPEREVELTTATIQATEGLSDAMRVSRYIEDGGEIVDISNSERLPDDGFGSDQSMMHSWNQARTGMKEGIASMARRNKR